MRSGGRGSAGGGGRGKGGKSGTGTASAVARTIGAATGAPQVSAATIAAAESIGMSRGEVERLAARQAQSEQSAAAAKIADTAQRARAKAADAASAAEKTETAAIKTRQKLQDDLFDAHARVKYASDLVKEDRYNDGYRDRLKEARAELKAATIRAKSAGYGIKADGRGPPKLRLL